MEQDPLLPPDLNGVRPTTIGGHQSTPPPTNTSPLRGRKKKISRISYSPSSHVQVLFQMHGSVLPQVLPFCVSNVLWTLLIETCRTKGWFDLTFRSTVGHSFMGILVSFLVVSRSRISYQRFMEIRKHLGEAHLACREVGHFSCMYTLECDTEGAKEWRREVAYRTIILLRVTMDVLNWSSTKKDQWETTTDVSHDKLSAYRHGTRTLIDENFRAPLVLIYNLREIIMQHPLYLEYKMPVNEYRDLIHYVSAFNKAYHGFRDLVFTPYPFPLAQMTRIFLFFWVYSLPLVLLEQMANIYDTLVIVFFMTFGFIGVEYVSMTLDDPFGDDAMDFDEQGMAETCYEDMYLTLYKMDGPESVGALRRRISQRYAQGEALDNFRRDMMDDTFWERSGRSAFSEEGVHGDGSNIIV
uniref:Bestrophin homolog n=1 Tax=Amphora coffeiformis TaxID=265554 RepID=A0A7S3LA19_9STRA